MQRTGYALFAMGLAIAVPLHMASAHHSGSMYDGSKVVTLKGTVQEFRWVNPHVVIIVMNEAKSGAQTALWSVEMSSPGNMRRYGWSGSTLRQGQPVEIAVAPMRDGTHGAACRSVKMLDSGNSLDCSGVGAIKAGETPNLPER